MHILWEGAWGHEINTDSDRVDRVRLRIRLRLRVAEVLVRLELGLGVRIVRMRVRISIKIKIGIRVENGMETIPVHSSSKASFFCLRVSHLRTGSRLGC